MYGGSYFKDVISSIKVFMSRDQCCHAGWLPLFIPYKAMLYNL